jgi:hypothetical protein
VLQAKGPEGISSRFRRDDGVPFLPTKRKDARELVSEDFSSIRRGSRAEYSCCELIPI